MRKVKSRDTYPEVVLRKALWARGLRYRLCVPTLPGKPDIVLSSRKLAIFVDGDFWHGNQWKSRKLASLEEQFKVSEKRAYWVDKIRNNERRDLNNTQKLLNEGWRVLRFWESQIDKDLEGCIDKVFDAVKDNNPKPIVASRTFAEFFAGIGLMRMGLERQGWTTVFANDIDELKYKMYRENFQDAEGQFLLGDIHNILAGQVPTVTLATASFPCNDLSLAGARDGLEGKQSSAYWGFVRILRDMGERRPLIVLLENVAGLLSSHKGEDFKNALIALNDLGYLVDAFILNAADFVPQSRVRLFVVATQRDSEYMSSVRQQPQFYESPVRPKALAEFIMEHPEIGWRIRALPAPQKKKVDLKDIIEVLPDSAPEWWSEDRTNYLLNQMSEKHSKIVKEMINGKDWSYATVFRRIRYGRSMAEVRNDGIAGCLRTPRGGSGRQILIRGGKGRFSARLMTPRECARLMGADNYNISVPLNQALFGFGDAVCVPVIEWIAINYLNPLMAELMRGHLMEPFLKGATYASYG